MNPIEAGDVRDRQDQYKGVGVSMNDPFEQFRKNKSQTFISRMKARDDGTKSENFYRVKVFKVWHINLL